VNFRTDQWTFSATIVDDFEDGLPSGTDGDGNAIGFTTFNDAGSSVAISTTSAPPAPVPGAAAGNSVLQVDTDVNDSFGFAGVVHAFENEALDTWTPQDWSTYTGFSFWLYGNDTGKVLFVDLLDNRAPGSTGDTAERYSLDILDDFSGWRFFQIPFSDLSRKEVGNGAPNDGLTLTEVHGWAFGVFNAGVPFANYIDDVSLYGVAELPELTVGFAANSFDITEGTVGDVIVKLNRPMIETDPAEVTVAFSSEPGLATPDRDYVEPADRTLTFVNGGPSEMTIEIETLDDTKWEGTQRVILRLSDAAGALLGPIRQASADIIENDPYDPDLLDDFEVTPYLWEGGPTVALSYEEVASGASLARPGQDAYEGVLRVDGPLAVDIEIEGNACTATRGVIPVNLLSSATFDATTVDHSTVAFGEATEAHVDKKTGEPTRHVEDANGDGLLDLVFHFRANEIGADCTSVPFNGSTFDGQPITAGGSDASFGRDFPMGMDWSNREGLSFWYYGTDTGDEVGVHLKDNRAPDPGPSGWDLVWSDEFDDPAGTSPNPDNWGYEIGDGVVNGIPGWGNDELEYYTDDPANAATDGEGNLVITALDADGEPCYYGECAYTSARLVTKNRAEFAYGRIESRILVPDGPAGLWPAFWSLGTDIDLVDWPQTGEIDFMEYVSRLPNEIFGTIHGPGYSGGQSYGDTYDFGVPVAGDYHTFTIEWEPDRIEWFVDGYSYHTATPADVAPNPWVFNDPVYFLLNLAVGGNFGGQLDPALTFPQSMKVDYVRVYQGPDTAERFEATFLDDFTGWQLVEIPFSEFTRSDQQPAGAPDDGLGLEEVWGYGFTLPDGGLPGGVTWIDLVRADRTPLPPGTPIVIDDFEDGTSADWVFFGGNNAGGGGGVLDDRPKEGSYYWSTGWGGGGSASVFYGGAFKNLPNAAQVTPPDDPWFNVWVFNQSDATVDQYTLEITIREDLDGNGWTNGSEDSFRLDTVFPSSTFNDEWTLVSAPLSEFIDLETGGNGTFDGKLDEVVIVISGVAGAEGTTVEVDFDLFAFTSGEPLGG
jgi:beta-glucanase (GH16 family)